MLKQFCMLIATVALLVPTWYATAMLHRLAPYVHRPVYMTNLTQCRAYKVTDFDSLSTKKSKDNSFLVKSKESPHEEDRNGPDHYAAGPQIVPDYWLVRGPVVGSSSLIQGIFQIIHDPASYGPGPDPGIMEHLQPDHVFVLSGNAGFLLVEMQSSDGSFAVNKYDSHGAFIETSGSVRGKGDWQSIIDQAFPTHR